FMPHLQAVHFVYAAAIDKDTKITLNAHTNKQESESYRWFSVEKLPEKMLDEKEDIIRWRDLAKSGCAIDLNL
ncbi:MAG: hypothetical protein ACP5UN_01490, partial [Candidatus Micrarchaeia archaeon]